MEKSAAVAVSSPIMGLNSNITIGGQELHIQTEDLGSHRHAIVTHVFANGGTVVDTARFDYGEHLDKASLSQKLTKALKAQHGQMIRKLQSSAEQQAPANESQLTITQEIDIEDGSGAVPTAEISSKEITKLHCIKPGAKPETVSHTGGPPPLPFAAKAPAAVQISSGTGPMEIAKIPAAPAEKTLSMALPIGSPSKTVIMVPPAPPVLPVATSPAPKERSKEKTGDLWAKLVKQAKEEYDRIFNEQPSTESTPIEGAPEPQDDLSHHPEINRPGGSPRNDILPPQGPPPSARIITKTYDVCGVGWDAAVEHTRSQKEKATETAPKECHPQGPRDNAREAYEAFEAFDEGLAKVGEGDNRSALVAWARAIALDPDNRKYRVNLAKLLGKMERAEGEANKELVSSLFS
jgi:hypothetical protein